MITNVNRYRKFLDIGDFHNIEFYVVEKSIL